MWLGTHHSAQKPTTTGTGEATTSRSQLASVKVSMRPPGGSAEVRFDQLDEIVARDEADTLLGDLAAFDDEQRGERRDVVLEGNLLVLFDVDLPHPETALELLGHGFHRRHQRLARRAPVRPEVDQHRLLRLNYVGVPVRVGEGLDRIGQRSPPVSLSPSPSITDGHSRQVTPSPWLADRPRCMPPPSGPRKSPSPSRCGPAAARPRGPSSPSSPDRGT